MRNRRGGLAQALSVSGIVRNLVGWILALDRSAEFRSAAEQASVSSASTDRRNIPFAHSAGDQEEIFFEDLPEGFHDDVDSITVAVGGHHTCALEYRPGVDFGGPVRCWGRDDWGQSTPSDDIFVQVQTSLYLGVQFALPLLEASPCIQCGWYYVACTYVVSSIHEPRCTHKKPRAIERYNMCTYL